MLLRRMNYIWRLLCTGAAFALFSLGGLLLSVTVFPALAILSPDPADRRRRFRLVLRTAFRLFIAVLDLCGVLRITVAGRERLRDCRGRVVVANHPSLLDVVILGGLLPNAQCIVKPALWRHPFLGPVMRSAGYIPSDAEGADILKQCQASLAVGDNLIIFPEGTRSRPEAEIRFQRGFASIATLTGAGIQPIFIRCDPPTLLKGDRWYDIPDRRVAFEVSIGEPVAVDPSAHLARGREARRLTREINGMFAQLVRP